MRNKLINITTFVTLILGILSAILLGYDLYNLFGG